MMSQITSDLLMKCNLQSEVFMQENPHPGRKVILGSGYCHILQTLLPGQPNVTLNTKLKSSMYCFVVSPQTTVSKVTKTYITDIIFQVIITLCLGDKFFSVEIWSKVTYMNDSTCGHWSML